jgi:hypothetical protein
VNKRDIINFLFILSFPVYGIGTFVSAFSPSVGFLISASLHILIVTFYLIDIVYKRLFHLRLNVNYVLMLLFILSSIASIFIALYKNLPEATLRQTITRAVLLIIPFHAYIAVVLYNDNKDTISKLTLISLSLLLAINLIGYFALGLTNATHSIEGRLNFPFLDAFYSGASLLAVINLILLDRLRKVWSNPIWFSALAAYLIFNLALFYIINSRLAILIFILIILLMLFGAIRVRGLYLASMFTLPILLSSGPILFDVLNNPAVASVIQRVDVEDVATFHGRSYLWKDAFDWLLYDQRGILFGNGYKGHYFLDLVPDVVKLWNEKESHHLHLHSTSLEILVCQGVIFFLLYCLIFYRVYIYFKQKHREGIEDGSFFPVTIFLLFIMQVDTFLYLDSMGPLLFALLVAQISITPNNQKENKNSSHKEKGFRHPKNIEYGLQHSDTRT